LMKTMSHTPIPGTPFTFNPAQPTLPGIPGAVVGGMKAIQQLPDLLGLGAIPGGPAKGPATKPTHFFAGEDFLSTNIEDRRADVVDDNTKELTDLNNTLYTLLGGGTGGGLGGGARAGGLGRVGGIGNSGDMLGGGRAGAGAGAGAGASGTPGTGTPGTPGTPGESAPGTPNVHG